MTMFLCLLKINNIFFLSSNSQTEGIVNIKVMLLMLTNTPQQKDKCEENKRCLITTEQLLVT